MTFAFAVAGCPLAFDFNQAGFTGGVMVEAAPTIVFRSEDESALDRFKENRTDFFNALLFRVNVEVVITALPDLFLVGRFELAGG